MTERLSMLALVTDAYGGRGGIAQYNRDFFEALSRTGRFSAIRILPRVAENAEPPAGVVQLPPKKTRANYIAAALKAAFAAQVDVVFCGHLNLAPVAGLIARLTGAKLVFQMHGIEAWPHPDELHRAPVERADLVLCVSRYTRARVLDWAAIAPERVLVLPNTVADIFAPGEDGGLRAQWGLEGKTVLLTVGRMDARERYKGHDRVIRALPDLVKAGRDVAYVVLGEGDDMVRLKSLAAETGMSERVRFMGEAGGETLAAAYRMADLFVMPSTGEGFGIVFLEAMASGTPALGLAAAGAADALADGELGMMASEETFASRLSQALAAPQPDKQVLSSAVHGRFGQEAFARAAETALDRLQEAA